ncbi:MAG TPA: EamA family transporter [Mycobacteriales bacterium]|nr:EamA family transporter [Mycobacteriales bacterium]
MSVALALLASALWGAADFLGGVASRRLRAAVVVGVSQFVALLGLLPLVVLTRAYDEPTDYLLPAACAAAAGSLALGAFYRALALGTMGVVAPIAALGVALPVGVGLARGESPHPAQLAGMAIAVLGVVLASGPQLSGVGRGGLQPVLLALGAALGFGLVILLIADASSGGGGLPTVVMVLLTMRVTSVLLVGAFLLATRRSASRGGTDNTSGLGLARRDLGVLVAIGVGDVGANGAYALASQGDLLSVTAVLASLYPVVTALLAFHYLRERLGAVQVVGSALALVGIVLLAGGA